MSALPENPPGAVPLAPKAPHAPHALNLDAPHPPRAASARPCGGDGPHCHAGAKHGGAARGIPAGAD